MRLFFNILLLLLTFPSIGQPLEQAVFTECLSTENPIDCTNQKFKYDIWHLINEDIIADLKNTLNKNYFSISVIFVTDGNGQIINKDTEIRCENILYKKALENYIINLPSIHPKEAKHSDRRTLHTLYYTYMYDSSNNKYYPISTEQLYQAEKVLPDYFETEFFALYPGCKHDKKDKSASICTVLKIYKIFNRKINLPDSIGKTEKVRTIIGLIIEDDGTVIINYIIGDNKALNAEFERMIKTFPKFKPATMKGFNIRSELVFPVTIH